MHEASSYESFLNPHIASKKKPYIKTALLYPEKYSLAMSNLGFQVIYNLFESHPNAAAERFVYSEGHKPGSLETKRNLKEFDVIALSLSFEPDFFNFLEMLKNSDIPLFSSERPAGSPLIVGGGIAMSSNPEPYAKFLDIIFLGEGDLAIYPFIEVLLEYKKKRWIDRKKLLERFADIPGFYIPSLNKSPSPASWCGVKRVELESLDNAPACSQIISKKAEFKDTFLLEINRGCPWKCLFCMIGWTSGKPRFLNKETAIKKIEEGLRHTKKLGLVGTALASYNDVKELIDSALNRGGKISFSSLRLVGECSEFLEALKKSGQKMITIAPEAGAERLRYSIGKEIKDSGIEDMLRLASQIGLKQVKLYFMYGLPGESEEDIMAIAGLMRKLREKFREIKFIVSLSPFVPKPWTPLQSVPMEREEVLRDKLKFLKKELFFVGNIRVTAESIRRSICEGLLSRGDRGVIEKMLAASSDGLEMLKGEYLYRERPEDEPFPWDFIDNGLDKKKLYQIYKNRCLART